MAGGNIKVVVRCRPLNSREIKRGAKSLVRMEGTQTILDPPETVGNKDAEPGSRSGRAIEKKPQVFSFDKSYWSAGPPDEPRYASQQTLYNDLGVELLDHSFEGFNTCIIAYGQTGSGKSYSMMGYGVDKGIIPLTTAELFQRVIQKQAQDPKVSYTVEVSYIEIYNEKVRDLLNPKNKGNLRVREHPSLGPYVEDLSRLVVENYEGMMTLMDEGNKARTVASTNMNETSSRSHAVFTLVLTQKRRDEMTGMDGEKVSKISLVDLAGSERANSTGATGARLKEGANINKSLTTLGKVIAALAHASSEPAKGRKKKDDFVPYRDSVLTWLLKESLGGNSMTAVIAAISPADYEETLSTLRYADAAKQIKTHAVVNEDPNAKLIRELKEELEVLRARAAGSTGEEAAFDPSIPPEKQIVTYYTKDGELRKVNKLELQDQLQASEKLMESLNLTWEEKLIKTQAIHVERERALEELGISVDKNLVGLHAPQRHPSLVNLNEDPLMSECLVYQIKPGRTVAGNVEAGAHIKLSGSHILAEHCVFDNKDGFVTLEAMPDSLTMVNGKRIPPKSAVTLQSGYRVILGDYHVFRYNDPAAVRKQRELQQIQPPTDGDAAGSAISGRESPSVVPDLMDWTAARREAADFEKLGDQDLDKLFDDIVKVRTLRRRPESRAGPPETWSEPDLAARLTSTAYTEESLDAGTNPWGPTGTDVTSPSISTPNIADLKDESRIDDRERSPFSTPPKAATRKAEDAEVEQQHMQKQLRHIAEEMKRLRSQAVARALEHTSPFEPEIYSAGQLGLLHKAVTKWKRLRPFAMAEDILSSAVELREANVIATQLSKNVRYNFTILPQRGYMPISHYDDHTELAELKDDAAAHKATGSGDDVAVVVIDPQIPAVYIWGIQKFRAQLVKMRSVQGIVDRPSYNKHFRIDVPFFDRPAMAYSFIGSATISLGCLSKAINSSMQVPISCPYTMEALGSCRVTLKVQDQQDSANTSGRGTPDSRRPFSPSPPFELVPGSKMSFVLVVDSVKGLSSEDFSSLHAQSKLSSFTGPDISADDVYASHPVDLMTSSVSHLSLRRSITIVITQAMISHMREKYATVDFFAKAQPAYLSRMERWFEKREVGNGSSSGALSPSSGTLSPVGRPQKPSMRRCETDFVGEEHHDIVAWLEILELGSSGQYAPAEVPVTHAAQAGVFQLHQGLQRRIHLSLSHSSGKALPIGRISHVKMGVLRFNDSKGQVSQPVSTTEVDIRLPHDQEVEYFPDGTARIDVSGVWDSSAHDSILLNRKTSGDQTILARMTWLVEFDSTDEPAVFSMDVGVKILDRDARPASRLLGIFSSTRILSKTSTLFTLTLSPPLTRSPRDLWRLDTARKHVRGEEGLGEWKPRGVSLLEDFTRVKRLARNQADVQAVNAVLENLSMTRQSTAAGSSSSEVQEELLRRCVDLWQQQMRQSSERKFERDSPAEAAVARRLRKLLPDLAPKLVPVVKQQSKMNTVARAGYLHILKDSPDNLWARQWMVLRRPYLHLYDSNSEKNETGVINLTGCSVILSPDVEMLLERQFAFTIFTRSNSYIIHAVNAKEMNDWVQALSTTGGRVGPVR